MYKKTHYNKKQTHLCFLHRKTYFYNPEGDLWQRRQRTLFLQPRREADDAIFIGKNIFLQPRRGSLAEEAADAIFITQKGGRGRYFHRKNIFLQPRRGSLAEEAAGAIFTLKPRREAEKTYIQYFYNPEGDLWQRRPRTLFLQPRREAEDAIFFFF